MARPRAIQGEVEDTLLYALECGLTIRLACEYVGISYETYRAECERNPAFAVAASRARRKHLPEALNLIRAAAPTDWRAAKAFVELVAQEEYGRQRLEVSGPDGGPVQAITAEVSPDFFAAALRRLDEAVAESAPESPEEPIHS